MSMMHYVKSGDDDDETAMDVKLFKTIGLYQLLCPSKTGWYRTIIRAILWLIFSVHIVQMIGLYFVLNDLERFMFMTVMILNSLMCLFKAYVMVTNADQLWSILDVARYVFTSCSSQNTSEMHRCRATVSALLRVFTVISYSSLVVWITTPWFMEEYVSISNMDGTVSYHRTTIYNQWYPVSDAVYNSPIAWTLIYTTEVAVCCTNVFSWSLFDCYVLTTCFFLKAHFNTLSTGCEGLGHDHQHMSSSPQRSAGSFLVIFLKWTQRHAHDPKYELSVHGTRFRYFIFI